MELIETVTARFDRDELLVEVGVELAQALGALLELVGGYFAEERRHFNQSSIEVVPFEQNGILGEESRKDRGDEKGEKYS